VEINKYISFHSKSKTHFTQFLVQVKVNETLTPESVWFVNIFAFHILVTFSIRFSEKMCFHSKY